MRSPSIRTSWWAAVAAALSLAGCTADAPVDPGAGQATLAVQVDLTGTVISTVVVEIAALDLAPVTFSIPIVARMASGSVTVTAGSGRVVTMRAYDANGIETHRGAVTVNIVSGVNPAVSIVLQPLTGDVAIVATLASFVVTLTPGISVVAVGQVVALTATVRDANNALVSDPVVWGTLTPAVATVTSTGPQTSSVATAGPGTATIVATYGGAAASAKVVAAPPATPTLQPVATGLQQPLYVTAPPGDTLRVFIVQQTGVIRVMRRDTLLATPFLDVSSLVINSGEQGLLSMAFHPAYASNGQFFLYYSSAATGAITIARYKESTGNPNVADPASGQVLLSIPHADYGNHNGGLAAFGPDGYLYLGTGDGGGGGDPLGSGQDSTKLLGKILRIDVNAPTYAIPPSNPFVGRPPAAPEVWAYGMRNPWRYSFDRVTGDLYIGDVGQNLWEEIDFQPAGTPGGRNYGWNVMEGFHCYSPSTGCTMAGRTLPVFEYAHGSTSTTGCSIDGGYVYRGTRFPSLYGRYFFADYCTNWVKSLKMQNGVATDLLDHTAQLTASGNITSFGEDGRGELYITAGSTVYRIAPQ